MIDSLVILVLVICLMFISVDLIMAFLTWQKRIRMGRYSMLEEWGQKIIHTSQKWLIKTPKIKVTDNTRLILIDILKRNYSKNTIQYWQQAGLLLGLANDGKDHQVVTDCFLKSYLSKKGNWIQAPKEIDAAILAYAMMEFDQENRYKLAYDEMVQLIENHIGEDGTVKYRHHMPNYRYVDTVGFICPFLTRYGLRFNQNKYIDLAFNQIIEYRKQGFLTNQVIPYHAYDINNAYPLGLCGWGRGIGWYAVGLIDMWRELPNDHPYKIELNEYVIELTHQIIELQNQNGSWNWTVTRPEARPDSSTTAILLWFLVNARTINDMQEVCRKPIERAVQYLMSITRRDGSIDFSQGDTKDIGVYSMLFDILPFTQGIACRAMNELLNE